MDIFKGLRNANVFERGVYLSPGQYVVQIERTIVKDTRKSGNGFIVEFKVLETSDAKNHPAGSKATWFQSLRDKDVAFGAIKEFMYAVLGYEYPKDKAMLAEKVDPQLEGLMNEATGEKNVLAGKVLGVRTFTKKTKEKGLDFTVHQWSATAKAA